MRTEKVKIEKVKGIDVLKLEGDVVFEISNDIKDRAKELLRKENSERVVVDLRQVPFMDSSGIGMLISLFKNIKEREGDLALASPTEKVRKVISLTRLDKIMNVYDSVDEALEYLGKW